MFKSSGTLVGLFNSGQSPVRAVWALCDFEVDEAEPQVKGCAHFRVTPGKTALTRSETRSIGFTSARIFHAGG